MSIDRVITKPKHPFFAAGAAVTAALVMTLSPFSVAVAMDRPTNALSTASASTSNTSTAVYERNQSRIQSIHTINASEVQRYQREAQEKAEAEAKRQAEAEAQQQAEQAAAEAASYTYVQASTYGEGDGCMYSATASGAQVTPTSMAVAMKTMPLGTTIQLTYNGKTVTAVVNDRGPYVGNRQIDLQPAVAHALSFDGVGTVGYKVVS
ncbi:MAG: septal ring lytic transglycosylase RlpA family protein [Coriobacteriales bacterium]|nr:septal ring lytic transglycosylase RlpA family protein [Coriobacteriales bacterium]